jgi:hypothetical protein
MRAALKAQINKTDRVGRVAMQRLSITRIQNMFSLSDLGFTTMTFRKGQSGNPGGRGSDKLFRDALLALKATDGNRQKIRRVADALVAKAIKGGTRAIALIADRIDGRAGSIEEVQNEPEAIFGRAVSAVDGLIERVMAESKTGTKELI